MADVEAFIAANDWTFAKTMPQSPHWYLHRDRCSSSADFVAVVEFIREHGERRTFGKRRYVYLDIGEFTYWTMGSPIDQTIILNRAELSG